MDFETLFQPFKEKMLAAGLSERQVVAFQANFKRYYEGASPFICEEEISPPSEIPEYSSLTDENSALLRKAVVIKLNGGLGTSMGLEQAKSLLPARKGLSFLEIIGRQALSLRERYNCDLPVIFMNSFRTERDTSKALGEIPNLEAGQRGLEFSFLQSQVPKVLLEEQTPIEGSENPELEWCPPGHGDIYLSLAESGLLDKLLEAGIEYAFLSNADNLGAELDLRILTHFAQKELPFLMEVAHREEADRKGGHLAKNASGGLLLRERAQCPDDAISKFENIERYRYFNTNSIWLSLRALKEKLEAGTLELPVIQNKKTLNPRDPKSPAVLQLETAMGSAISVFEGASALAVPRTRFAPVKTTNDLLNLWSDRYVLTEEYSVNPSSSCTTESITISLDSTYFQKIDQFQERFASGAPSLKDCSKLSVTGDFKFRGALTCKGEVSLKNSSETQVELGDIELSG